MLTKKELLKIKITAKGIKIAEEVKEKLTEKGRVPLSLFEYPTTAGISLIIDKDVYVNAPFADDFCKNTNIILDFIDGRFIINEGDEYEVSVLPLPDYFDKKDTNGNYYRNIIMTHTDRMRISPIKGCFFRCKYCDLNLEKYEKRSVNRIIEAIEIALKDKNLKPKHLLISGGTPRPKDRDYLDNVYKKVTLFLKKKNIPVDIMLAPRPEKDLLENLYSWGVNSLSINLEIYNLKLAEEYNPQKAKIGKEGYKKFIEKAVKIFGVGKVKTLFIIGLEPISETLKGVEEFARIGCDIVLSPFRPAERTLLAKKETPTENEMVEVYEKSRKTVDKYGVVIGPRCIPCQHNALAFPYSKEFFYN